MDKFNKIFLLEIINGLKSEAIVKVDSYDLIIFFEDRNFNIVDFDDRIIFDKCGISYSYDFQTNVIRKL